MNIDIGQPKPEPTGASTFSRLKGILKFVNPLPESVTKIRIHIPHTIDLTWTPTLEDIASINKLLASSVNGCCYASFPVNEELWLVAPTLEEHIEYFAAIEANDNENGAGECLAQIYFDIHGVRLDPAAFTAPNRPAIVVKNSDIS